MADSINKTNIVTAVKFHQTLAGRYRTSRVQETQTDDTDFNTFNQRFTQQLAAKAPEPVKFPLTFWTRSFHSPYNSAYFMRLFLVQNPCSTFPVNRVGNHMSKKVVKEADRVKQSTLTGVIVAACFIINCMNIGGLD